MSLHDTKMKIILNSSTIVIMCLPKISISLQTEFEELILHHHHHHHDNDDDSSLLHLVIKKTEQLQTSHKY
jgi:hypothetical protein